MCHSQLLDKLYTLPEGASYYFSYPMKVYYSEEPADYAEKVNATARKTPKRVPEKPHFL